MTRTEKNIINNMTLTDEQRMNYVMALHCPGDFDLVDFCCDDDVETCKECWKRAIEFNEKTLDK